MTHATRHHRRMDHAAAEAMARDGGEPDNSRPALRSRDRGQDARSLSGGPGGKVLLCTLSLRTSARGNQYLAGYLGKAAVVGFQGEPDKHGNATFDLFLSEPRPREGDR